MSVIALDPDDFLTSAQKVAQVNEGVANVLSTLTASLSGTGGMAGDDWVAAKFSPHYDTAASGLVHVTNQYVSGAGNVARALHTSVKNHVAGRSVMVGRKKIYLPFSNEFSIVSQTCPAPPASGGNTTTLPHVVELIRELVEMAWPNANLSTLRTAAAAWHQAADLMALYAQDCTDAEGRLADMSVAELKTATGAIQTLHQVATELGVAFGKLGDACDRFASHVETQKQKMVDEVNKFIKASLFIEGVGLVASVFTADVSEAFAQGVEVERATALAVRVGELMTELDLLTALEQTEVREMRKTVDDLAKLVGKYAAAGNVVDFRGTKVTWSYVWTQMSATDRGNVIEDMLGQNLPQTFPVWDRWDKKSGVAVSIKSMGTEAGMYSTQPSRIKSRLLKYIKDAADFRGASMQGVVINSANIRQRVLELAIPADASAQAKQAIADAISEAQRRGYGVTVQVVEL